jgi:hypothetical protein
MASFRSRGCSSLGAKDAAVLEQGMTPFVAARNGARSRERRARQILKGERNELKKAMLSYSVSMIWARKEFLLK